MAALFADYPEALRTSVAIAERCAAFDLTENLAYRFPEYGPRREKRPLTTWNASAGTGSQSATKRTGRSPRTGSRTRCASSASTIWPASS